MTDRKIDTSVFDKSFCHVCVWDIKCRTCKCCCNCGSSENDCCDIPNQEAMKIFENINKTLRG